jgi:hypothetical protein
MNISFSFDVGGPDSEVEGSSGGVTYLTLQSRVASFGLFTLDFTVTDGNVSVITLGRRLT